MLLFLEVDIVIERILDYFIVDDVFWLIYKMFFFVKLLVVVWDLMVWVILDYVELFEKYDGEMKFFEEYVIVDL